MRPVDKRVSGYIAALPGGRRAATVVAVLMAAAGVAVMVFLIRGSDDSSLSTDLGPAHSPFYLEATIVVLGPSGTAGVRPQQSTSTVQWWYGHGSLWHWQIDTDAKDADSQTTAGIADGKDVWVYDSETNTYTKVALKDNPSALLPDDIYLGPVDIDDLTQKLEEQGVTVSSGGMTRFLNRDVQVLQYSPTWQTNGPEGPRSGGVGRMWVDSESGLVLRNVIDKGSTNEYVDAKVTLLTIDPQLDKTVFQFEAPEGSVRVQATSKN